jgi:hypothetical protein
VLEHAEVLMMFNIRPKHRMVPPVLIVAVDPGKRRLVDNINCGVDLALVHLGGHQKLTTILIELIPSFVLSARFHITCPPPRPLFCPASSSVDSPRANLQSRP